MVAILAAVLYISLARWWWCHPIFSMVSFFLVLTQGITQCIFGCRLEAQWNIASEHENFLGTSIAKFTFLLLLLLLPYRFPSVLFIAFSYFSCFCESRCIPLRVNNPLFPCRSVAAAAHFSCKVRCMFIENVLMYFDENVRKKMPYKYIVDN